LKVSVLSTPTRLVNAPNRIVAYMSRTRSETSRAAIVRTMAVGRCVSSAGRPDGLPVTETTDARSA
jgi:hypothetical protein